MAVMGFLIFPSWLKSEPENELQPPVPTKAKLHHGTFYEMFSSHHTSSHTHIDG
jgi:hypothetical protein